MHHEQPVVDDISGSESPRRESWDAPEYARYTAAVGVHQTGHDPFGHERRLEAEEVVVVRNVDEFILLSPHDDDVAPEFAVAVGKPGSASTQCRSEKQAEHQRAPAAQTKNHGDAQRP